MEISMAKAIRKTPKSSTNVPQGAPPASPEKIVTSAPRVPRAQEDAYGMVDAGELWVDRQFRQRQERNRAKKAAEQAARIRHVEGLRAQMQKAGVDMSKPAPGISRLNPDTQMAIDLSGKPFMSSAAAKEKAKNNRGFKGIVKRILRSAGNILSGSHQNVSSRHPIEGKGIKLNPPINFKKKS